MKAMLGTVLLAFTLTAQADEAGIAATWAALDRAWNARDAGAFSEVFVPDATLVFVDRGHVMDGRAAIIEHFTVQFPQIAAQYSHHSSVSSVRALTPGFALMDGEVQVRRTTAEEGTVLFRRFAIHAVMAESGGVWRIVSLRAYQLPQP
jgi:uncharacterized protein (TIGR02246 family)